MAQGRGRWAVSQKPELIQNKHAYSQKKKYILAKKSKTMSHSEPKNLQVKLKLLHPSSSLFIDPFFGCLVHTYPDIFNNGEFFPFSKNIRFHSNLFRPSTPKPPQHPSRGACVVLCMTSSYSKASDPLSLKQYSFHCFPLSHFRLDTAKFRK